MLGGGSSRPKPRPPVVLAWGSQSMMRVGRPSRARDAAKLMAVVVLPTPPFWLTTAMTLEGFGVSAGGAGFAGTSAAGWSAGVAGCAGTSAAGCSAGVESGFVCSDWGCWTDLFFGWMVIIGVWRRVSGGWAVSKAGGVVEKSPGLWRTCGT